VYLDVPEMSLRFSVVLLGEIKIELIVTNFNGFSNIGHKDLLITVQRSQVRCVLESRPYNNTGEHLLLTTYSV